ncbi:MAG: Atu4866 domain-containing protein, partial [Xanthobacteraceae bacterium]
MTMEGRPRRCSELLAALIANEVGGHRPILLAGGAVLTLDPRIGDWERADVLICDSVIVAVGPGLSTGPDDDDTIVIDCEGTLILPSHVNFADPASAATLFPAATADIAVIRLAVSAPTQVAQLSVSVAAAWPATAPGRHLDMLIAAGRIRRWNGKPIEHAVEVVTPVEGKIDDHPYLGTWIDEDEFVRQELLPGGRYEEARGDRQSAYRGAYWIQSERIVYRDDLGFWAFGEF